MRIAEYKQIGTKQVTRQRWVPDDADTQGVSLHSLYEDEAPETTEAQGHYEDYIEDVPVMGMVYRDMTEEEEARVLEEQAEFERYEATREPTLEEKIDALMRYQGLIVKNVGGGVFEVVKEVMPEGDYTHPVKYTQGMSVEAGKWYYTDDVGIDLPREAVKDGIPVSFYDASYFEWV